MAPLAGVLVAKPDDLSLITGTHIAKGKNAFPEVTL